MESRHVAGVIDDGRSRMLQFQRPRIVHEIAFAIMFPTRLGEAGEGLGMDRLLKSNTAMQRVHSLFRQGCTLYDLMPGMPDHRHAPLGKRFADLIHPRPMFQNALSKL